MFALIVYSSSAGVLPPFETKMVTSSNILAVAIGLFQNNMPKTKGDIWNYFLALDVDGNPVDLQSKDKPKYARCKLCDWKQGPNATRMAKHLQTHDEGKEEVAPSAESTFAIQGSPLSFSSNSAPSRHHCGIQ